MTIILEARQLGIDRYEVPLLRGVDIVLQAGQCVHLQGGNGVGKSTLLRAFAGYFPVASGQLFNRSRYTDLLAHDIAIEPKLTVLEHLMLDARLHVSKALAIKTLSLFGLAALQQRQCVELSRGQMQRVALARLSCANNDLLLLDEPMTACDATATRQFELVLAQKLNQGAAVVFTSHELHAFADLQPNRFDVSRWAVEEDHASLC